MKSIKKLALTIILIISVSSLMATPNGVDPKFPEPIPPAAPNAN